MGQQLFYSTKSTGTYADTLAAFGLAEILEGIVQQIGGRAWSGERIWIRDDGPYYVIELAKPLPDDWAERCKYFNPAQPITTSKQPWKGKVKPRDYDAEREKAKQYFDARNKLGKAARTAGAEDLLPERPRADSEVVKFVGDYRMQALKVYNKAIKQWEETQKYFITNIEAILQLSAEPYPDVETVSKTWLKAIKQKGIEGDLTASQLFNPVQGQGQNQPKANRLNTRHNMDSFWLLEYLKGVGLWKCAVPRTVRGGNARKTYVVSPKRISLGSHNDIFTKFGDALWNETSVKMDIFAALKYAQMLIEYSEAKRQVEGRVPDKVITGLYVTTYKLLSQNSYTTMNLAFLGIPEWIGEISMREKANAAKEVINEHIEVIRQIDEKRSEGYYLLQRYRDFLSARELTAFFDFCVGYSQFLTHELEQKHFWVQPFTKQNLRRVFMGNEPQLSEIIDNEGFRHIAYAIRRSTIIPQYRKASGESLYEVRYGLGAELKRKAAYKIEFISALSDFLQTYNAENAQKYERTNQQMRQNYHEQDLAEVVRLVDKFGSEVVCHLLIAFGYASESEEEQNKKKT